MPFLTVNGVTVPIDSASVNWTQIMPDVRSYMGYSRKNRVGRKRSWACKTPMMDADLAQAIGGIIQCRGDVYGFDDLTLFSQKGVLGNNAAGTASPIFMSNSAAADGSFNPEAPPFSSYAIYPGSGRVNRLAANDATFETSNPFTTVGSVTVASDSTRYYQGTKSVKITDTGSAAGRGIQSANLSGLTAGTASCLTIMVYNGMSAPLPLQLLAQTTAGSNVGVSNVTVPVGGWSRIYVPFNVPSGGAFRYQLITGSAGNAGSWWVDAAMLEYASSPSPWVTAGAAGVGATAPVGTANFALPFGQTNILGLPDAADGEVSVGVWTQFSGMQETRTLFNLRRDGTSPQISVAAAAGFLSLNVTADDGTFLYSIGYTVPNSNLVDAWHYVVVNMRSAPRKGGNWGELYVDGVLVANAPGSTVYAAEPPNLNRLQELQLFFGLSSWNGQINEIQLNPFVLPQSVIAQLYAAQPAIRPVAPQVLLSGGIVGNITTPCIGSKLTYGPMFGHYSTNPNVGLVPMTTLSFQLDEV